MRWRLKLVPLIITTEHFIKINVRDPYLGTHTTNLQDQSRLEIYVILL